MPRAPPVTMAMRPLRSMTFMERLPRNAAWFAARLEFHPVGALQSQGRAGFGRRRDLEAEILDDAADLGDLLGIAFRKLARADIERVLKSDADIAAKHRGIGAE